jgi:hypothetical protein
VRRMLNQIVWTLGLLTVAAAAEAQSVRAYLSQPQVAVGRQFVLNVEVTGVQQFDEDPVVPDLSAFAAFLGSGTSTSMQITNGRTAMSLTIQYRYQATTEGTFDIDPVEVQAAGQSLATEPLSIAVSNAPPPSTNGRPADEGIRPEDLFLTATPNTTRVYVNQAVVVEYRIFTKVDVEGYDITRQPSTSGFWVEELGGSTGQAEQVVRDGVTYASAVVRRVALYPTGAGTRTLEPLTVETQIRVQQRGRSVFGDPFDGVFGGGLFGRRVPVVVGSEPVEIEVLPLPQGPPPSFSGLVGALDVSASVDRTTAEVNDALTYRLSVTGTGNIRTLPELELAFPSALEVYPPEVTEQIDPTPDGIRGSKTFEYVLVPRSPGTVTLPQVELSYLDANTGQYAAAATDVITLSITGDPTQTPAGPAGRLRTEIDLERQDIRFIRIASPTFNPVGGALLGSTWFWIVALSPLVALGGAVAFRRHEDRLQGDVGYARRRRASRVAKQRLSHAESLQSPEQHREFYAEVGRALQGFLGDKLNIAEAGMLRDEVRTRLDGRSVDPSLVERYLGCLEDCDRQRFAPTSPDHAAMEEFLNRAGQAMTALDEAL